MIRREYVIGLMFVIMFLLRFFNLKGFPGGTAIYVVFFAIVLFFADFFVKGRYAKLILVYFVFLTISCIYSNMFNGQKLFPTIINSFYLYSIASYFVFKRLNLSLKETENVLVGLSICFCLCYILQWLVYPTIIFSNAEHNAGDSGYRSRMPGSILCYFFFLYGINQYLLKRKWTYVVYSLLGFIPIIIQGFRSMIALMALSAFLIVPFVLKSGKKTIVYSILGAVVAVAAISTPLVQSKIEEMNRRQETDQIFSNSEYIRWIALDYYWNQYYTKPYEKVFGGGNPVDYSSKYTQHIKQLNREGKGYHLWLEDLGIVGLSMMIGIISVSFLVLIYLLCMYKCMDPRLQCIRFTLFIVLIGSIFTTMELYRQGNLLILPLLLYYEEKFNNTHQLIETLKSNDKKIKSPRLQRVYGLRKHLRQ